MELTFMNKGPIPVVIAFAQVPPEWWHIVREIIVREGRAVRGNPILRTLEVKSLTADTWGMLMLPSGATEFADDESLRKATRVLWGMDPLPAIPVKQ